MTHTEKVQADYIEALEVDLLMFRELVTNLMLTLEMANTALQLQMLTDRKIEEMVH
jgi:hypothetical protein